MRAQARKNWMNRRFHAADAAIIVAPVTDGFSMSRSLPLAAFFAALFFVLSPVGAADATFTVSGVHIEAKGASFAEAKKAAIDAGRSQAWQVLFRRLTRQQDWTKEPQPDPAVFDRLIVSYFGVNERRSTTRYVADGTYIFNPDAVTRMLQSAGIAYATAQARRVLVIPMAPGYGKTSGWTQALANPRLAGGLVPFALPFGDGEDMKALAALRFDTANWAEIEPVAARLAAQEVVLMLALPAGRTMTVSLRHLGPRVMPVKTSVEVPLLQNPAATYPAAADAAVRALEDMWKSKSALDYGQKGKLTVDLRAGSLAQFTQVQSALAAVPNVSNVALMAMDIGMARLTLSYLGTADQLREALAGANLALTKNPDGSWTLSQNGSNAGTP
jgi:hypothetical protein